MLEPTLQELGDQFVQELKREFEEQGHGATGTALASFRAEVTNEADLYRISIWGVDYAKYVNDGRKAGSLPPVSAIEEWVKIRGIAQGTEARGVAWAIAKAIEKEGSPTQGSYNFTNNGRRKGFIDQIAKEQLDALLQMFRRALIDEQRKEIVNQVLYGVN